jgi:two-component sensor histidine kinase
MRRGAGPDRAGSIGVFNMVGDDAAERLRLAEERAAAAEQALATRDAMLREMTHRMRNTMQLVGSLIALQAAAMGDAEATLRFTETADRIRAIALALEHPARPGDMSTVDVGGYLRGLLNAATGLDGARNITVSFQAEPIEIAMQRAVPLGLLVNEILSNAVRHAFPAGRRGSLRMSALQGADGGVAIVIADDGIGLPPEIDVERARTLGLRLVRRLARQAEAEMAVERGGGTAFRITLAAEASRGA